jgi:PIN domain nuclease of toxin-antitoxin system
VASCLLDTHVWAWDLKQDSRLPKRVLDRIDDNDIVYVSAVSFYEIAQKVRLGKWPEMLAFATNLHSLLADQGDQVADMTAEIGIIARLLEWDHRDPFDRMLAATSIILKLPLISADSVFDQLADRKDWPGRIW